MREIGEFVDERQKSWCIHCSKWMTSVEWNEDHVPSKTLLNKPRPHHLPKVPICKKCNSGFSLDEQYAVAFLSTVIAGSSDHAQQHNASARRALERSTKLQERIERSKSSYMTRGGRTQLLWKPEIERVNRVVVKNARGHAYIELGEPMLGPPEHVWALPLDSMSSSARAEFEGKQASADALPVAVWPEVGSRMLSRVISGDDMSGPWIIVQDDVYRYLVDYSDGVLIRTVIWNYLATEVFWKQE
jgi:hypothetical protein